MKHSGPPKLAEKFLLLFLKDELAEEVLGDLDEKFYRMKDRKSLSKARLNYWYQVFNYLRPFAFKLFKSNATPGTMMHHNLKISYRILLKNKRYSVINVGGLAIGMSLAILIGLWIYDELSFNKNHEHYDRIVQVLRKGTYEGQVEVDASQVSRLGVYLEETYPTVFENVSTTFNRNQPQFLTVGERSVERMGYFFSKDVNQLLSLEFIAGQAFNQSEKYAILLSASLAKTLFPEENPIGKEVILNHGAGLVVSGVYQDLPNNSTFHEVAYIVPIELIYHKDNPATWSNYNTKVYALLKEGVKPDEAQSIIQDALNIHLPEASEPRDLVLLEMKDWHLNSTFKDGVQVAGKRMQMIQIYGVIGIFVLFLAFINFINLNTARCSNRTKEIGIKKSIGTRRKDLVQQFLTESFLYAFSSFLLSLLIVVLSLDWFNELAGKAMTLPWNHYQFWVAVVAFVLGSALVAGAYPAFFLSSFDPVKALKGKIKQGTLSARFRQVLVVFQFTISIALIIGTITVYNQLSFAKARPVGYDQSDLITVRGRSAIWFDNYAVLRDQLKKSGHVLEIATANYPLTNDLGNNDGFSNAETDEEYPFTFNTIIVNPEYGTATGWELIAGRDFSRDLGSEVNNIIVSEAAVKRMGLENPIGHRIKSPYGIYGREGDLNIIGVVKDMVKASPFEPSKPLMVFCTGRALSFAFIRLAPGGNYLKLLPAIQETFEEVMPGYPFNYEFVDDTFQLKFQAEERMGSLAILFSAFAILISCLGLFGLSAFVAEQRTKEIGIRKVLGASVANLWSLLSRDFSVLVLISCFISMPIASYILNGWLEGYAYRISIDWWVYATAGLACLLITFATVSVHALKSSLGNPVESLRSE